MSCAVCGEDAQHLCAHCNVAMYCSHQCAEEAIEEHSQTTCFNAKLLGTDYEYTKKHLNRSIDMLEGEVHPEAMHLAINMSDLAKAGEIATENYRNIGIKLFKKKTGPKKPSLLSRMKAKRNSPEAKAKRASRKERRSKSREERKARSRSRSEKRKVKAAATKERRSKEREERKARSRSRKTASRSRSTTPTFSPPAWRRSRSTSPMFSPRRSTSVSPIPSPPASPPVWRSTNPQFYSPPPQRTPTTIVVNQTTKTQRTPPQTDEETKRRIEELERRLREKEQQQQQGPKIVVNQTTSSDDDQSSSIPSDVDTDNSSEEA